MDIISRARGGGKTEYMVQVMRDNPEAVMVCISASECRRIAKEYGIDQRRLITAEDADRRLRGVPGPILADNLDQMLPGWFRAIWIASVTDSGKPAHPPVW